jgi:hypothetical protein
MAEAAGPVEPRLIPPLLYVPVADPDVGDEMTVEFHRLADGRLALLVYTALDRLVTGCGPNQPWVVLPAAKLDEIDQYQPYDVILLDVPIPEDRRRKAGERR